MSALKEGGTLTKKGQLALGAEAAKNMMDGVMQANRARDRQSTDKVN